MLQVLEIQQPDQYYYADGEYTGAPIGVAFVVGNGDIDTSNGLAGANPSNAFVVIEVLAHYQVILTIKSIRLKSIYLISWKYTCLNSY